jgi:hypothetical protein
MNANKSKGTKAHRGAYLAVDSADGAKPFADSATLLAPNLLEAAPLPRGILCVWIAALVSAGARIGYAAAQRLLAAPAQSECESPRRLRRPGSGMARPDGVRPREREKNDTPLAQMLCG